MVRVTNGAVTHDGIFYKTGEVIDGLSEENEARLVSLGAAKREAPAQPAGEKGANGGAETPVGEGNGKNDGAGGPPPLSPAVPT